MQIFRERSPHFQFVINVVAASLTFLLNFVIRFLLSPFVVSKLGPEAYGFIGVSMDVLSYTSLLTLALNSMAGRFIAIKYVAGEVEKARCYFSSVFYANVLLALVVLLFAAGCVLWLEYVVSVPKHLLWDVKLLFSLMAVANIGGFLFGTWGVATFIRNRLDLSNIRGAVGSLLNAFVLVSLFSFFPPHLWYVGLAGVVMMLYVALTNWRLMRVLTPDLVFRRRSFRLPLVKELLLAGMWNAFNKLGNIIGHGFDLLIANWYIGATAMGMLALARVVPGINISFFVMIAGIFAPNFTILYARNQTDELRGELLKSIRIMGFFAPISLAVLLVFGREFYTLWLPEMDAYQLHVLTVLGVMPSVLSMPLEALWNIFTVTNRLRVTSIYLFVENVMTFVTLLICLQFVTGSFHQLCCFMVVRVACALPRVFLLVPLYGAYCLKYPLGIFYPMLLRSLVGFVVVLAGGSVLHRLWTPDSWWTLLSCVLGTVVWALAVNSLIMLRSEDRRWLFGQIGKRLHVR